MKKIIGFAIGLFAFFELGYFAYGATYQPQNLGWATISIASGTVAEINASTAPTVGYLRYCTNCAGAGGFGTICISTSTSAPGAGSDFVLSTGTQCK